MTLTPRDGVRFALPALVLLLLLALGLRPAPPAAPLPVGRGVVVLLVPGLGLGDVSVFTRQGASGVMPTRASHEAIPDFATACRALARGSRTDTPVATPTLGDALRRAGVETIALPDTDNAARTVAGLDPPGDPFPPDATGQAPADTFPDGVATDPARLVRAVRFALPPADKPFLLTLALDDFLRADRYAPLALPRATRAHRQAALARLTAVVTGLRGSLPAGVALLLVSPTPSADAAARGERLAPLVLWAGTGVGGTLLTSPSTRHLPGLVAPTDTAATIAALLGITGTPIGAGRAAQTIADDHALPGRVAGWAAQARAQRGLVYVPWGLAVALLLAAGLRGAGRAGGAALAVGASTFPLCLIAGAPLAASSALPSATVYVFALLVCLALALVLGLVRPLAARAGAVLRGVFALTPVVLIADTLLGGPLLSRSPLSYSVVEGARFYGVGNEAAGVLVGASLALWASLPGAAGRVRLPVVVLAGGVVALLVGLPGWGANAGAFIGAIAGWGWVAAQATRPRWQGRGRRVLAGAAAGLILLVGAYALWDAARSGASRSHIGEAVVAARAGGPGVLVRIAARKAATNLHLLVASPWAALLVAEGGLCVYARGRGRLAPALYPALVAAGALFVFNDSGVLAAATCLLYPVAWWIAGEAPPVAVPAPPPLPDPAA